ncbi:SDR family oxidoreductase [Roseomonas sp. E05]|uniref:SDR family oxidoreductase n=1 Tax=Roseomonas sp. E05 TaxID=3046310 RepID=UPI0024B8F5FD|nr:SDR family oxidoreductase [Roseomonas sp. E05]MDJ0390224.1 SDR family oxidoreductase [Roseomonas sp. E05]
MEIAGCTALVTGANRGLGKAFVEALLQAGAAKVYAGSRKPGAWADPRIQPIGLDVTRPADIAAAAEACADVNLLVNNAGVMLARSILAEDSEAALRQEMEVNVFGVLGMARAFAPVLRRNGGGALVNMLSVVSWYVYPFNATYCTSKFAALAATDALRIELKAQGTRVVGVYAGFIDTDMAARVQGEKTAPRQVAERALEGIRRGWDDVRADKAAEDLWAMFRADPAQLRSLGQTLWDEGRAWAV